MRTFSKVLILFLIPVFVLAASKDPERAKNGMVVTASKYATDVGVNILENGGNAVDATVAVGFTLAVTHPSAGNIGGGGFMVVHLADGKNLTIDFRETAPLKAYKEMYLDEDGNYVPELSRFGITSVGVPGSVAGLIHALEKYGTMSLTEVIQPAIDLAENGFNLEYRLAESINIHNKDFNEFEGSKKIFTKNGDKFNEGDLFIQKDLAETLKRIKQNGRDGFYKGKTADLLVAQSKMMNGYIEHADLENYKVAEREPVTGKYKGHEIISMGPPSSGGIAIIQTLNTLENFEFEKEEWHSSRYIHTITEILKYVYADRSKHLGDPDFYDVPQDWLLSNEYSSNVASKIKDFAQRSKAIAPQIPIPVESEETTHYSVADKNGNAVSVTTTLNSSYGSKVVVEGAGFLLNNEMDDFSAKPGVPNQYGLIGSEANSIAPNKRMLSSMSPTIVLKNDQPYIIIGSPGGSTIITTVLQVILNVVDFDMNIQEAIDMPRFHHQWLPDQIDYEKFCLLKDVKENLIMMKHKIGSERVLGRANGIVIDNKGYFWGATDPRGFGKAKGF